MDKPEHIKLETTGEYDKAGRSILRVQETYYYKLGEGTSVKIPKGYRTNLGTVPRIFWRIVAPTDLESPAVIHDYLCNEYFGGTKHVSGFSRWMADAILYETCIQFRRIPKWKACLVYWGVRAYVFWTDDDTERG